MEVNKLVWQQGIQFLNTTTKQETLAAMIKHAASHPFIKDAKALEEGIHSRERIISTGIGLGVAIPHAKISGIKDFFITVAVLSQGVDWDSIDEEAVKIVLMIVGPDNQQTQYLQILAKLSLVIKNQIQRETILKAKAADEIIRVFANIK